MSDQDAWGFEEDLDMAAQKNPEAGWLVDDVLVLKFVIRVKQKVEYSLSGIVCSSHSCVQLHTAAPAAAGAAAAPAAV
eukprot:365698-Chlamydomonas_euryale.AAC.8